MKHVRLCKLTKVGDCKRLYIVNGQSRCGYEMGGGICANHFWGAPQEEEESQSQQTTATVTP
jgi:hypothetical protein